jgi:hypothetical protein
MLDVHLVTDAPKLALTTGAGAELAAMPTANVQYAE